MTPISDMEKVYDSTAAAIHDVPEGATIMFGGFVSAGSPTSLILALYEKGTRDLTGIANNIGLGDKLDVLCEKKQLRKMIASCGFASVIHGNPLTWDDQRRKLDLLVDTARKVWG